MCNPRNLPFLLYNRLYVTQNSMLHHTQHGPTVVDIMVQYTYSIKTIEISVHFLLRMNINNQVCVTSLHLRLYVIALIIELYLYFHKRDRKQIIVICQ